MSMLVMQRTWYVMLMITVLLTACGTSNGAPPRQGGEAVPSGAADPAFTVARFIELFAALDWATMGDHVCMAQRDQFTRTASLLRNVRTDGIRIDASDLRYQTVLVTDRNAQVLVSGNIEIQIGDQVRTESVRAATGRDDDRVWLIREDGAWKIC